MDKTYLTAGILILVGIIIMAISMSMILAVSPDYWNDAAYGTTDDWVKTGKQLDLYYTIGNLGMIVAFFGIAVIAFGLATAEPKPQQYRPVETVIPPQQYPPRP